VVIDIVAEYKHGLGHSASGVGRKSTGIPGWGARVIDRLADDLRRDFPEMSGRRLSLALSIGTVKNGGATAGGSGAFILKQLF
jgi:hypothetical protein